MGTLGFVSTPHRGIEIANVWSLSSLATAAGAGRAGSRSLRTLEAPEHHPLPAARYRSHPGRDDTRSHRHWIDRLWIDRLWIDRHSSRWHWIDTPCRLWRGDALSCFERQAPGPNG